MEGRLRRGRRWLGGALAPALVKHERRNGTHGTGFLAPDRGPRGKPRRTAAASPTRLDSREHGVNRAPRVEARAPLPKRDSIDETSTRRALHLPHAR